ncbi:single-stranded DNA-binding protein [Lewinella sp. 4G2]|uniref:single-stranded DNA-binding protein n=1 Tax=Lewinella sp. 4G2 TaxID=1803372 RepID=UPI0007B486B6|nr:single-stranded DNA-binding protein [Lewinella sp. 4G2]OAV45459.1 hypothetical protein A3850_013590 [Lewinella sp. 4G2]
MSIRNNVSLIGNLGAAPNVTTTASGTNITDFSLATNEYFRDREGNRQTRTMWHRVKAFGKTAEILGQYLQSGSQVAIEGRINYSKWVDKHDQVRVSTEIIVEDFTFLSAAQPQQATGAEQVAATVEPTTPASVAAEPTAAYGDNPATKATKPKRRANAKKAVSKKATEARVPLTTLIDSDELPF